MRYQRTISYLIPNPKFPVTNSQDFFPFSSQSCKCVSPTPLAPSFYVDFYNFLHDVNLSNEVHLTGSTYNQFASQKIRRTTNQSNSIISKIAKTKSPITLSLYLNLGQVRGELHIDFRTQCVIMTQTE